MKHFSFCLLLALPLCADVKFDKQPDHVNVQVGGKPFTAFYFGPDTMKPYLHPLRTATGVVVTRSWPMEQVEGESKDHPHHQGVWFTHGDVNGLDFWANPKPSPKHGKVTLVTDVPLQVKGGGKSGTLQAEFRWLDPNGKPLLREQRRMTFYDDPANRIVDFDITLTALDEPVKFGDTKEGTFAIRMHDKLTEKSKGATLVSSTGAKTMKDVWGKPAPWVDYSGKLNDAELGIAIFDHPANPKHPTHWHARDYGLFAANIFGEHDFYRDKTRDGSVTLAPGKSMRFRYRVLIHPGLTDAEKLGKLYEAYKQVK